MVRQIYAVTDGVHRHVDMILPRILRLTRFNEEKLADGSVTMSKIISLAGSRLMTGM
jgi:hypothetical protein